MKKQNSPSENLTGTVKFYQIERGFGFIISDKEDHKEYFFHCSNTLSKNLTKGNHVSFRLEEGPKGLKAVEVTLI